MITTIARREVAEAVGTGRIPLLFVLVVVVLGTGMLAMSREYQARMDAYALIRPDETDPVVAVPPSPLSLFARELDDAMGRRFEFGPGSTDIGQTQAQANPLFGVFPTPDWLFLFRVVLSLLAFLAGYDLICREKAQGTLKLLLAGGASRAEVALGKWLGSWIAFIVPVLLAALLWVVLAAPLFGVAFRPGDPAAIGAFLGLGVLYLTVCFTMAAALSALFHDQTTALVSAILVWAVVAFVVPNLGVLLARQLAPAKPLALVASERRQAFGRGMIQASDTLDALQGQPTEVRVRRLHEGWGRIHLEKDRIGERAAGEAARLASVTEGILRVSPAGAFEGAAARILGTSVHDELALRRRIVEHKNAILPDVFRSYGGDEVHFPAFEPPPRSLSAAVASRATDLVALVIAAVLSLLVFFTAVREYDVR